MRIQAVVLALVLHVLLCHRECQKALTRRCIRLPCCLPCTAFAVDFADDLGAALQRPCVIADVVPNLIGGPWLASIWSRWLSFKIHSIGVHFLVSTRHLLCAPHSPCRHSYGIHHASYSQPGA